MAIAGDYPTPVSVNGFSCKNCTDVDYAKKHIDPAHPKDGPYGVDAKDDPKRANDPKLAGDPKGTGDPQRGSAFSFGGALAGLTVPPSSSAASTTSGLGTRVDLTA